MRMTKLAVLLSIAAPACERRTQVALSTVSR